MHLIPIRLLCVYTKFRYTYYADCGVLKKQLERAMREVQGCSGAGPRSRKPSPKSKFTTTPLVRSVLTGHPISRGRLSVCRRRRPRSQSRGTRAQTDRARATAREDIDSWSVRLPWLAIEWHLIGHRLHGSVRSRSAAYKKPVADTPLYRVGRLVRHRDARRRAATPLSQTAR